MGTTLIAAIKYLMACDRITVSELRWLESIIDNPAKWTFNDTRKLEDLYSKQMEAGQNE